MAKIGSAGMALLMKVNEKGHGSISRGDGANIMAAKALHKRGLVTLSYGQLPGTGWRYTITDAGKAALAPAGTP